MADDGRGRFASGAERGGQGLHRVGAGRGAAAEDEDAVADRGGGGIVQRAAEFAGRPQLAAAVEDEDAGDRGFGRVEAAEHEHAARDRGAGGAGDGGGQRVGGGAGAEHGRRGGVRGGGPAAPGGTRARASDPPQEEEDRERRQDRGGQQEPASAMCARRLLPPRSPRSVGRRLLHVGEDRVCL